MPDPARPKTRPSDWALFRRLLAEARPYRLHLLALFGNGLLQAPATVLAPLPLKIAVDSALGSVPLPRLLLPPGVTPSHGVALAVATGLLIAISILRQLQTLVDQWLRAYLIERQTLDLRARLFLHSQRLSLTHHDRRGSTDAITRIEKDVRDAQSIVVESLSRRSPPASRSPGCCSSPPGSTGSSRWPRSSSHPCCSS